MGDIRVVCVWDADDSEVMDVVMVHRNLRELFMMVSYSADHGVRRFSDYILEACF